MSTSLDERAVTVGARLWIEAFRVGGICGRGPVAELGAACLGADLGLSLEPREDHASYIANWLEILTNDSRAIFTAASHAQRAADLLHRLQLVQAVPSS